MGKIVKLSLELQPDNSYQVQLVEIKVEGNDEILAEGISGELPNCQLVYEHYQLWQEAYQKLAGTFQDFNQEQQWQPVDVNTPLDWMLRQLRFLENHPTVPNISSEKCRELINKINSFMNEWLDYQKFQKIENTICTHLNNLDEARIIIKTQDLKLCQLPWGVWDLFENYRNAEVVFSPLEFREVERKVLNTPRKNVRILALFGNKTGIDYRKDQEDIKKLALVGAKPAIFEEPSLREVSSLLWEKEWDIFFFAGHSESHPDKTTGKLSINSQGDALTPEEFKNTLKNAIDKGLKIAFLNSCDGLGLAQQLIKDCNIPLVIAMREPVPNIVAQEFLNYFLLEYAYNGKLLHVAVKRAKERILEEFQKLIPGLDWLPVIYQNPAFHPPKWNDLHRHVSAQQAVLTSLACTALVITCRFLGLLQPMELSAYDQLIRLRPPEPKDERILIVTISEADIQYQERYGDLTDSLSDQALNQILTKFAQYQPRAIGLDIYRSRNLSENLIQTLKQFQHFIAVCKVGYTPDEPSIRPPSNLSKTSTVGFTNIPLDPDHFIRRQWLRMETDDTCNTPQSFNLRVALRYLEQTKGSPPLTRPSTQYLQLGNTLLHKLEPDAGGYQLPISQTSGFQILLNYRNAPFDKISLRELLNGTRDTELNQLINNRIILIGANDSNKDIHSTPYSTEMFPQKMSGVEVQAHAISQIISAVLDGRPLLFWWPMWGEILWIGSWSLMGGLIVWGLRSPFKLILSTGMTIVTLSGVCLIFLIQGFWIPLIPAILAILITSGSLIFYINSRIWLIRCTHKWRLLLK